MATLSEQPVFKELSTLLVKLSVSDDDPNYPNFRKCQAANCNSGTKGKEPRAKKIWDELMKKETLSNEVEFYLKVKKFLLSVHCKRHNEGNFLENCFGDWERSRTEKSGYASSEVSLPSTPTQNQVFESPTVEYGTPLSSPLVEDGTPTTSEKSPASSFDSFILSTPSRMNHDSPLPSIEDMSTSNESPRYNPPLALGINSISGRSIDVGQQDNKVDDISPKEPPKSLPIHSRQDVAAEQPDMFSELGLKRNGTLSDKAAIIMELRKPLTYAQAGKGKMYVLKHKEEKDLFKIGWTSTTVNTSLSRPNNCYGASCETVPIYESPHLFNGAPKAHRLVHLFLRGINIRVKKCRKCGKGHKDWFEGIEEAIVNTVKVMEGFLLGPAYELKENGELTNEGKARVNNMCNVTLESFQRNQEYCGVPGHITDTESLTFPHTVVPEATANVQSRQALVNESSSQPEALAASADASKGLEPPSEANKGEIRNKLREFYITVKDKLSKFSATDDEFPFALLGALDQDSDNTGKPRGWSSLGVSWARFTATFRGSVEPDAKKAS
ncbi:hypothetical protein FCOIX_2132 [Fusarium coicis]|nr:hypothetical protein FCOIX_2132 [Fusarium coicis]